MTASLNQVHMAPGDFQVDFKRDAELIKLLPKFSQLVFYKGERKIGAGVVLRRAPVREKFTVKGRGLAWYLAASQPGPLIRDLEFLSGQSLVPNGGFDFGLLYWSTQQDSQWRALFGGAYALGNNTTDDALVSGQAFEASVGQQHQSIIMLSRLVSGLGRVRLRHLYSGRFAHPNLLPQGNFETGGWSASAGAIGIELGEQADGLAAMVINTIPKPQLVLDPYFALSEWSAEDEVEILTSTGDAFVGSSVLVGDPIPYPQSLLNPAFDLGPGFPWAPPVAGDLGFVNDATKAFTGSWSIKVGPIRQKQIILNTSLEAAGFWFPSSELATPDAGIYYLDPGGGVGGSQAITHAGVAGGAEHLYLRADANSDPTGVDPFAVVPGEAYEMTASLRAAPGADGIAYISGHIPHPTVPSHEKWFVSSNIDLLRLSDTNPDTWQQLKLDIPIPDNRFQLNALLEVHGNHNGYVAWDEVYVTRVRGNRDSMTSIPYPLTPGVSYRISAFARSGATHQVGTCRIGITLSGSGLISKVESVDQSHTDYEWAVMERSFTPSDGYIAGTPFIQGDDIYGDAMYIDNFLLEQTSNNTRRTYHFPLPIIEDQRYLLEGVVRSETATTRGATRVGVLLTGPGMADQELFFEKGLTKNAWAAGKQEVRPPAGYTAATPFVEFQDIEGGRFFVGFVTLTKMDNNTDSTTGPSFPIIPMRTYKVSGKIRSTAALLAGTVKLHANMSSAGRSTLVQDFSALTATEGQWKVFEFNLSSPSGYDSSTLTITGVDVDGGKYIVDTITVVDSDATTMAFDQVSASTYGSPTAVTLTTNAPSGSDHVSLQAVLESGGMGWLLDNASTVRTDKPPATLLQVAQSLLTHPKQGGYMLSPGTIHDPTSLLRFDWRLLWKTPLQAFSELVSTGLLYPSREWAISPEGSFSLGLAEELFTVRDNITLTPDRTVLLGVPFVEEVDEDYASDVEVVGAELKSTTDQKMFINASVGEPPTGVDWMGRPLQRTLLIQDPSLAHLEQAELFGQHTLDSRAKPAQAIQLQLSDWQAYGEFFVGDWINVFSPEGNVQDLTNPKEYEGETIWPASKRVISMVWNMAEADFKVCVRYPGGKEIDISRFVLWSEATTATVEVGDINPDFNTNQEGGPTGQQFLDYMYYNRR